MQGLLFFILGSEILIDDGGEVSYQACKRKLFDILSFFLRDLKAGKLNLLILKDFFLFFYGLWSLIYLF